MPCKGENCADEEIIKTSKGAFTAGENYGCHHIF